MATRLLRHAPILLVSDVVASANFYRDKLGFTYDGLWGTPPAFCILERDGLSLMLSRASDPSQIVPHWKIVQNMWNVYFWVEHVEELYKDFCDAGAPIDYELCDKAHGCREFGIIDPDGYDIAFGELLDDILKREAIKRVQAIVDK